MKEKSCKDTEEEIRLAGAKSKTLHQHGDFYCENKSSALNTVSSIKTVALMSTLHRPVFRVMEVTYSIPRHHILCLF